MIRPLCGPATRILYSLGEPRGRPHNGLGTRSVPKKTLCEPAKGSAQRDLTGIKGIALGWFCPEGDRIEQENEQLIRFGARTDDDLDGFEFKVSESARVLRFILEIDGSPRPAEVEVGRENFKPAENP